MRIKACTVVTPPPIMQTFNSRVVILQIKEVAPYTTDSTATNKFWKNDVRVSRVLTTLFL